MKKLLLFLTLILILICTGYSQIKFMGIPMDKTKSEMISELEKKGFTPDPHLMKIEELENDIIKRGSEVENGRVRENETEYFLNGYFDGKECTVIIIPYKGYVSNIIVAFNQISNELNAKLQFNLYVDLLEKKYTNPFEKDNKIDLERDLSMPFDNNLIAFYTTDYDKEGIPHGSVSLNMTHPRYKEFYLILRYYNYDHTPNGEDL